MNIKHSSEQLAELALLNLAKDRDLSCPIFILAAPRTGSTYLYQEIVRVLNLPFISNITNECFPRMPIIGLAMQRGVKVSISDRSMFGKTEGPFQPSEGSGPMMHWFGGGHPSQDVSACILDDKSEHIRATLAACENIYDGAPLVIKNAWNCFRVTNLAILFPSARFIWVKRDIREAAESDLEARYLTKGDLNAWNSATPSNVERLQKLAPEYQVVENQFEFNKAIENALIKQAKGRWIDVWYEDFITHPASELERIGNFLELPLIGKLPKPQSSEKRKRQVQPQQSRTISEYVDLHRERIGMYCYLCVR